MCQPGGPRDSPGARAAGKAGALMASRAVRETVTLTGRVTPFLCSDAQGAVLTPCRPAAVVRCRDSNVPAAQP